MGDEQMYQRVGTIFGELRKLLHHGDLILTERTASEAHCTAISFQWKILMDEKVMTVRHTINLDAVRSIKCDKSFAQSIASHWLHQHQSLISDIDYP